MPVRVKPVDISNLTPALHYQTPELEAATSGGLNHFLSTLSEPSGGQKTDPPARHACTTE